jgi:hypothetical protein
VGVTADATTGNLRGALEHVVDADDSVIVIELKVGSHWSGQRIKIAGADWLNRNIRSY